jgi:hypothetical protein
MIRIKNNQHNLFIDWINYAEYKLIIDGYKMQEEIYQYISDEQVNNRIYFRQNNLFGCFDENGKIVIDAIFNNLFSFKFNKNLTFASFDNKLFFIIDKFGKILTLPNYNFYESVTDAEHILNNFERNLKLNFFI